MLVALWGSHPIFRLAFEFLIPVKLSAFYLDTPSLSRLLCPVRYTLGYRWAFDPLGFFSVFEFCLIVLLVLPIVAVAELSITSLKAVPPFFSIEVNWRLLALSPGSWICLLTYASGLFTWCVGLSFSSLLPVVLLLYVLLPAVLMPPWCVLLL